MTGEGESRLSYLTELTLQLAMGAASLPAPIRDEHAHWLASAQCDDGGFAGREGESDPYYTAFALRALWVLGAIDEPMAQRASKFLRSRMLKRESVVDLISLLFAAAICELSVGVVVIDDNDLSWRNNVAELLSSLRTSDGGFAKTPEGKAGSTYQTFLTVLCYELMEVEIPEPDAIVCFLESQAHKEGGFLEIRVAKRAGVNPTAAAIGILKALGRLDALDHRNTIEFLSEMQSDEGGLTANTRIPFADLLSTCTGLITLNDLNSTTVVNVSTIEKYALAMQRPGGGFAGLSLDDVADVEYTFYGVATLALCNNILRVTP